MSPAPAGSDDIRHLYVVLPLKGVHKIEHAVSGAGAEIDGLGARVLPGVVHRLDMADGQIHHVDIVPHPGAVVGIVIVAEHRKLLEFADGDLGDDRA